MEHVASALNWFEIPVSDFDRARAFYSKIFDYEMPMNQTGSITMGFFSHEPGKGIGGAICKGDGYEPSSTGTVVYLNGGKDLSVVLARIPDAGGRVLMSKTELTPELGHFAMFKDSEGNRVALHSME